MVSGAKTKDVDFVVRLVGRGIKPSVVPMRALTKVLDAVQRLVEQRDEDADDEAQENKKIQVDPARILHLVKVKSGSAVYAVAGPDRKLTLDVLSLVGRSIERPRRVDWTNSTLSSLKDLSEVAKTVGCEIEFSDPAGGVIAKIKPSTYGDISVSAFIKGRTTIYARIERLGGATEMHCGIRLRDCPRKMVICRVSSEKLVRELGQFMYQYVLLTGRAIWLRHNWRLKKMIIESFEPPKTGSILKALKSAHEAGGHAWDKIEDPDAFIMEMRKS